MTDALQTLVFLSAFLAGTVIPAEAGLCLLSLPNALPSDRNTGCMQCRLRWVESLGHFTGASVTAPRKTSVGV